MPSHLRLQAQFEPVSANATYQTSPTSPPAKRQKMSLTNIYYTASTARSKLGREANKSDHNLRLLVGHANLLDSLMLELSSAEREQEAWFNQSLSRASKPEEPKHIQWLDQVAEADEEEDLEESDDDGSDYDDDAEQLFASIPVGRMRSPPVQVDSMEIDEDDDSDIDEEFDDEHALQRVPSSRHSPPELLDCCDDDSSDSEDESMPSSPESQSFELDDKQRESITTTAFYDAKARPGLEDYIVQQTHQQRAAPLIAAF